MRRSYAAAVPRLLRVYGLKPWDLPRLTGRELAEIADDYVRLTKGPNDG